MDNMVNNNPNIKTHTKKKEIYEPWRQVFKNTWQDLSPNWYPNFIIGIVLTLITPAIGVIMSNKKVIIYGAAIGLTILVWLLAFYFIKNVSHTPALNIQKPKSLHDLFKSDFSNLLRASQPHTLTFQDKTTQNKVTVNIEAQIYADFDAQSIFLGFYIPQTPHTYNVCGLLAQNYKKILSDLQTRHVAIESRLPGDRSVELKDLNFSGRVFLYHEFPLFASEIEKLITIYKANSLSPQFRGVDYVLAQRKS